MTKHEDIFFKSNRGREKKIVNYCAVLKLVQNVFLKPLFSYCKFRFLAPKKKQKKNPPKQKQDNFLHACGESIHSRTVWLKLQHKQQTSYVTQSTLLTEKEPKWVAGSI